MRFYNRITLLLLIFFSVCSFAAHAVTASFTVDNAAGCAPLVVRFTNTSVGATSYSWNLGNGTLSTAKDVSGTYLTPGTYTATLVVSDGKSSSTFTKTITVYPGPTVSFVAADTSICPGATATFTSTSSGGVPGPMTYVWNFGDGTLGAGATATHAYVNPGFFHVTLSVTNAMGCVSTRTITSFMHIFNPLKVSFAATTTHFCSAPGNAIFTNFTTGVPPLSYSWAFGDGGTSIATNPTHSYGALGAYTVRLAATDGNGCTDSLKTVSYIVVSSLKAGFTVPTGFICTRTASVFYNTSGPHISSTWNFGDGSFSTADTGIHTYTAAGTYTVTLTVYDGFCLDSIKQTVVIKSGPPSTFTVSPKDPCPPPMSLTLTGGVPSGTIVNWIFGDGTTGTGNPVSHTFPRRAVDTMRMLVTDPISGCTDTLTQIDTFYDIRFNIIDTPTKGCKPLTVHFDYEYLTYMPDTTMSPSPYPYPIVSWLWDFGDGSPTTPVARPIHTYTAVGKYVAKLTVMSSNGCTFTDTAVIFVGTPPVVTAIATPKHICFGDSIDIPITVITGPVDDFYWDFGAIGSVESIGSTLHMYFPIPGVFVCTVSASYYGCMGPPFVITDSLYVDSPKAKIVPLFNCSSRTTVNFTSGSLGATSVFWDFGDGGTSTLTNPVHTYAALGKYTVKLIAHNSVYGCYDSTEMEIDLRPAVLNFVADKTTVCSGEIIKIYPSLISGFANLYEWDINGVRRSLPPYVDLATSVLTDTFHTSGLYTIKLLYTDQLGCRDSLVKKDYITVARPAAAITVTPPSGCRSLLVNFRDVSTDAPGVALTKFEWTFGDGGIATLSTPATTHLYTANGTYTVVEIVTDAVGCKDTVVFSSVVVHRPEADFFASNLAPCAWDNVYFTNTSIDAVSYQWFFGDGTTSSLPFVWHAYTAAGTYTVKLVATDAFGCTDTAEFTDYITISKPKANFYLSDSFSICPPLKVTFYNASSWDAVHFEWIFGDGNTSTAMYPSNLYTSVGHIKVLLIATDNNDCKDTSENYVDIFGYAGAFRYTPIKGCTPLTVHFKSNFTNVPNIVWDFADGVVSAATTIDSIDHTYTTPGSYVPKLVLSDNTGCENSSMGLDTIKVNVVTPGFSTIPLPVCEKGTMHFKDTSRSFFATVDKWLWTFSNGDTSTAQSPSNFYDKAGNYDVSLKVTDSWGCFDSVTQTIVVFPPPVIKASTDTIVCLGDGATLTGYGGISYTWEPSATVNCNPCNPAFASPKEVTTYTVTGTDKYGCANTDMVTVRLKTKTISKGFGDTTVCRGVVVPLHDSGATKFTWIPAAGLSDPTIADPMASPDTTTNYLVIAQLGSCIPDSNYILVTIHPVPSVDAGPDQTIVNGSSAQIRAAGTNITSLSWGGDSTLSCNNCPNPIATPFITTTYIINVTSSFGCPGTDSVKINVYCDKSQIFVPNTFTPNGDGENDVFYPRGRGITIVKSFRIYNRWGQMMFERKNIQLNDASNAWDGWFMGDSPRPDVYVWVVDAVCDAGDPINVKGDVTIIR